MRVIAGTAKGVPIKFPKGAPTRPATELVRGAIFSMLAASDADWSDVLDLFSGSGSLGIEALSRGAGWVDFVDQNKTCCAIIRENLEKAKLADRAHINCMPVDRAIDQLDKEYGIVLMDPPYANRAIGETITHLAASKRVGKETVVVITHAARFKLEESYGPLRLRREYRHGDSVIAVYRQEVAP